MQIHIVEPEWKIILYNKAIEMLIDQLLCVFSQSTLTMQLREEKWPYAESKSL